MKKANKKNESNSSYLPFKLMKQTLLSTPLLVFFSIFGGLHYFSTSIVAHPEDKSQCLLCIQPFCVP